MSRSATTASNPMEMDEEKQRQVLNQMQQLQQLSQLVTQKKLNEQQYSFQYLGIPSITRQQIIDIFGGIRIVVVMGPESRAKKIANACVRKINVAKQYQKIGDSEFFSLYKIDCVLSCSNGMGLSSVCLFLNELLRIMDIAQNNSFEVIRLGSSGGIGMEGGSLVVSTHSLDPITMKPEWTYYSCGHQIKQECIYTKQIYKRLFAIAKAKKYNVGYGKTVSTETYYEAQGRLDGSLCQYTESNKMAYLQKLHKNGVRNFEMEGTVLSGICTRNNIKCGMIAVSYLNRLKEDTVPKKYSKEERDSWMDNAIDVLLQYIYQFVLKK
eukprot:51158_1